ncbi:flagellar hook-basal body protein [Bilifractor sp. LCP21S3_A7]|jgi:flagellar basal-body rod protein FlgG|uniref:flagellar hook-basal body protein n=1 Tax=Bilifractor sp. LCP21S3_A7 TaxID=3438738 RepID=UPI003F8F820B
MDMSFWTGAVGASAAQKKLDIVSNNLANVNTNGFKPKNASFTELVKYNLNAPENENTDLATSSGAALSSAPTNFRGGALHSTDRKLDFALTENNTFFRVRDQATGEMFLTRNGHFHAGVMADGRQALLTDSNQQVLDMQNQPVYLSDAVEGTIAGERKIGIFTVPFPSRLQNTGENNYSVREGDRNNPVSVYEDGQMVQGALESSGTDMAREMTNVIEAQRAFSYNLRMVAASDEIMTTINGLHN